MTERLFQFLWQFQYFNKTELSTITGDPVEIIHPGQFNSNQGPDFSDARVRIGSTTWIGAVELHLKTSDWIKHHHENDKNYRNVILHVVWENDDQVNELPVIELKERVSKILLERFEILLSADSFIPCEKLVTAVPELTWNAWKERLLAERLSRKAVSIKMILEKNNHHWEESFWRMLARNFGIPVNAESFEWIAYSLPLKILNKHSRQIHQLESLLMGQAGLLNGDYREEYPKLLQREYQFLKKKYRLEAIPQSVHFLRMRPANFPTIRLAQLAMLIHLQPYLFDKIRETEKLLDLRHWFDVTANDYWHYHYRFDETSAFQEKKLGQSMIDNILINTVCPVLFTLGEYHQHPVFKEKAVRWLMETSAEINSITRGFQLLGIDSRSAFDSQALLELKKMYCDEKRCLECAVGSFILKGT